MCFVPDSMQSNQAPLTPAPLNCDQYAWFDTASGRYLQHQEQLLFDQAVVDLFGFNALQMGCLQMNLLRHSRIAHRFKSSDCFDITHDASLLCSDDFLPIANTSLDLLLLPHRLEFSERPHQTLREAERVMMPEGHLLISGFNPFSWWGLSHLIKTRLSGKCQANTFPWTGKFIGLNRLKDWLILLGFEVVSVQMCCHIPPFEHQHWLRRFHFMHRLGARWLPLLGGVYFIVAKKRVACMTPLKPNWKKSALSAGLVARPTQRKHTQRGMQKSDESSN
jgi:SAM-dependent methyltransferase